MQNIIEKALLLAALAFALYLLPYCIDGTLEFQQHVVQQHIQSHLRKE